MIRGAGQFLGEEVSALPPPAALTPGVRAPRGLSMITKEKHAHSMLFFSQIGITPIAEVSRAAELQFSEGILGAPGGPAWQHGGMAWRAAGGYLPVTLRFTPTRPDT